MAFIQRFPKLEYIRILDRAWRIARKDYAEDGVDDNEVDSEEDSEENSEEDSEEDSEGDSEIRESRLDGVLVGV